MSIRAGGHPPLRSVPSWDGQGVVWCCDACGCRGVDPGHVPGDEVCRLMRSRVVEERVAKVNRETW